jgi:hypothetical protein
MPIQKFRSIEEMNTAPLLDRGLTLERRIAALLARSAALAPPFPKPQGVFKFRTFDEMQAERETWERARVAVGLGRTHSVSLGCSEGERLGSPTDDLGGEPEASRSKRSTGSSL